MKRLTCLICLLLLVVGCGDVPEIGEIHTTVQTTTTYVDGFEYRITETVKRPVLFSGSGWDVNWDVMGRRYTARPTSGYSYDIIILGNIIGDTYDTICYERKECD